MSADEIKALAQSRAIFKLHCKSGNLLPRCREWCPSEESKKCKEADEIRSALLAYAAMVERCEKVKNTNSSESEAFPLTTDWMNQEIDYILKGGDQ